MKELSTLHTAVANELLARIQSGEARPADLAVAVKFLKDNDITALPVDNSPLKNLVDSMPFPSDEEIMDTKKEFTFS